MNSLKTVLISVDWLIVLIGILGNTLVIVSILFHNSIKNTVNRMLFVNLAITDLGVLVVRHSFHSIQLYLKGRWAFGEIACKFIPPVSRTFLTVSIVTLVAISHHRYNSIVHVLHAEHSVKKSSIILALIWLTTLGSYCLLDVPFRRLDEATERCTDSVGPVKYIASVIAEKGFYVVCFVFILYMFSKMKKALLRSLQVQQNSNITKRRISQSVKTLQLLKPTVFVLFITLFPAWLLHTFVLAKRDDLSPESRYLLYHVIGILMVINSSANPFIYVMASRSFKNSFRQMLCGFCTKSSGQENFLRQNSKKPDELPVDVL